jgi:hypothetical protein
VTDRYVARFNTEDTILCRKLIVKRSCQFVFGMHAENTEGMHIAYFRNIRLDYTADDCIILHCVLRKVLPDRAQIVMLPQSYTDHPGKIFAIRRVTIRSSQVESFD